VLLSNVASAAHSSGNVMRRLWL